MSTTKVEYMVAGEATKEIRFQLRCDSQSAIYLTYNKVYHARTKHIDVRFYKFKEIFVYGNILLENVHTS